MSKRVGSSGHSGGTISNINTDRNEEVSDVNIRQDSQLPPAYKSTGAKNIFSCGLMKSLE